MFILTRTDGLENSKENIFRVRATDMEKRYLEAGYLRRERIYKVKSQYKEFTVICPEFRYAATNAESVVIIPEFLVPKRPYPIYVYLYAIDLYSENPNMGQRNAAKATRERFCLESFAHTTLGRALKAFVDNVKALEELAEACFSDTHDERRDANGASAVAQESANSHPGLPTTRSTGALRKHAAGILGGRVYRDILYSAVTFCLELAGTWFKRHKRLLL